MKQLVLFFSTILYVGCISGTEESNHDDSSDPNIKQDTALSIVDSQLFSSFQDSPSDLVIKKKVGKHKVITSDSAAFYEYFETCDTDGTLNERIGVLQGFDAINIFGDTLVIQSSLICNKYIGGRTFKGTDWELVKKDQYNTIQYDCHEPEVESTTDSSKYLVENETILNFKNGYMFEQTTIRDYCHFASVKDSGVYRHQLGTSPVELQADFIDCNTIHVYVNDLEYTYSVDKLGKEFGQDSIQFKVEIKGSICEVNTIESTPTQESCQQAYSDWQDDEFNRSEQFNYLLYSGTHRVRTLYTTCLEGLNIDPYDLRLH